MSKYEVLSIREYDKVLKGISVMSDNLVWISGEQTVKFEDGKIVEHYLYDIEGYTPENGKKFASLKANIILI